MKTKLNFKRIISNLFIGFFILTVSSELLAQEKKSTELKDFKIVIENTDIGIKMTCKNGCAWTELIFNLEDDKLQAIDEYGMTELNKNFPDKDTNLADLLFTLTKTKERIILKGIKGTAWADLSFSLSNNKQQAINQMGMIE